MIKVIIERTAKMGKGSELRRQLFAVSPAGMHQPGYISGETLEGYYDPDITVVIATWRSHGHWQKWFDSAQRQARYLALEPLLASPVKVTVLKYPDED